MSKVLKAIGLALVLSVISNLGSVAAQNGDSGCSDRMSPFLLEFAVDSYTKSTGNLTLKVTITYCPETSIKATCDLLTLSVYPVRGLTYTGEDTLQLPYRGENPFSVFFDVIVPPNDTSALIFLWECGFARWDGQCFATSGDTLVTFRASPSFYSDLSSERTMRHLEPYLQKDYERAKREWEEEQERLKNVVKSVRRHLPGWSAEEAARRRLPSKTITMDSLHKLEETLLTEYSAQFIQVGDTLYVRRKGEYKFKPAETYASREEMEESRRNRKPGEPGVKSTLNSETDDRAVFFTLEPVDHPDSAGPVDMKFGFTIKDELCTRCKCCDEIPVEVITTGGLQYHGDKLWIVRPSPDTSHSFSTILSITLPDNDTSSLRMVLKMGNARPANHVYFVTTGDSVEFWKGYPVGSYWDIPITEPDTTKYEVRIDLRNPVRYEFIKKHEDEVAPIEPTADSGFYIIHITREQFDDLKRDNYRCDYLKEPPPRKTGRPGVKIKRTSKHTGPYPDSYRDRRHHKTNGGEIWDGLR